MRFVRQVLQEAGCENVRQHFTWSQQQCDIEFDLPKFHLRISCIDPKHVRTVIVHLQSAGPPRKAKAVTFQWQNTDLIQDLYSTICDTINPLLYGEMYDC